MAGGTKVFTIPTTWESFRFEVTSSALEITSPSSLPNISTIMLQAASGNTASIFLGDANDVSSTNAGGELQAGQTAVLPLSTVAGSKVWVISASTQYLYVSIYNGGNIC